MILCPSSVCQSAEIPWKEEDEGTGGHETEKKKLFMELFVSCFGDRPKWNGSAVLIYILECVLFLLLAL